MLNDSIFHRLCFSMRTRGLSFPHLSCLGLFIHGITVPIVACCHVVHTGQDAALESTVPPLFGLPAIKGFPSALIPVAFVILGVEAVSMLCLFEGMLIHAYNHGKECQDLDIGTRDLDGRSHRDRNASTVIDVVPPHHRARPRSEL